jgi:ligand-binding sensor domain-containing protein
MNILHKTNWIAVLALFYFSNLFASTIDSSYKAICTVEHFQPINKARISTNSSMGQLKDKRMFFYDIATRSGLSVLEGTNWSYIDESNFLKCGHIGCHYNDLKGNLWLGVDSGIIKYDGSKWKFYQFENKVNAIPFSIGEDKKGVLWIFCGNMVFNFINDKIVPYYDNTFNDIRNSAVDKDTNLWISDRKGTYRYNGTKWDKIANKTGFLDNVLKAINGIIYFSNGSTPDTLKKWDGQKTVIVNIPNNNSSYNYLLDFAESKEHSLFIVNSYNTLYKQNGLDWQIIETYPTIYSIRKITSDIDGNIWLINQKGDIAVIKDGEISAIKNYLYKNIGMQSPVNPVVDKKGNVWVSDMNYQQGISRYDGKNWLYFSKDSLSPLWLNEINSIAVDQNGIVYAGGSRLTKFEGNKWTDAGLNDENIHGLMFDNKNNLWYINRTINKFNGTTITSYGTQNGLEDKDVWKITKDKNNNIWGIYLNYSDKLLKFDGTIWTNITIPNATNLGFTDIEADSIGNIWLASNQGLMKYNEVTGFKKYNTINSNIPSNSVVGIAIDSSRIWMTFDSGIIGLFENDEFRKFNISNYNGFYTMRDLSIDKNKTIYVGSWGNGLLKLGFTIQTPEISQTNINCLGADNGKITLLPKKDTTFLYTIDGKNYFKDSVFNYLKAGNYKVITKQGNCYSATKQITITQPVGKFEVTQKNASCNGIKDGAIAISTDINNITYAWNNGQTSSSVLNIGKGKYSVNVKYGTCDFNRMFNITEPQPLIISGNHLNVCGNFKGEIDLQVKGGVAPYKVGWSNGDSIKNIKNLVAGNYSVVIIDSINCKSKDTTFKVKSLPAIDKDKMIGKTKVYICNDSVLLSLNNDFNKYSWFRNDTLLSNPGKSIYAKKQGKYKIQVVSNDKCIGRDSINVINRFKYSTPQICLVTVDDASGKNKIIWNKLNGDSSAVLHILKETDKSGKYEKIGNLPIYNSGLFTDDQSTPNTKADRYRLSLTDECKVISDSGTIHKTIHLTSNIGTSGEVNLIWSGYEGFSFGTYNIYRGDSKENMVKLTTIQSNLSSFTDENPIKGKKAYYQLEIINEGGCNPGLKKVLYNSTLSNIIDNVSTSIGHLNNLVVSISPNPAVDFINVLFNNSANDSYSLSLCDLSGKVVLLKNNINGNHYELSREGISSGIYIITIKNKLGTYKSKVVFR